MHKEQNINDFVNRYKSAASDEVTPHCISNDTKRRTASPRENVPGEGRFFLQNEAVNAAVTI